MGVQACSGMAETDNIRHSPTLSLGRIFRTIVDQFIESNDELVGVNGDLIHAHVSHRTEVLGVTRRLACTQYNFIYLFISTHTFISIKEYQKQKRTVRGL
jgi:hypothetical protein